MIPGTWLAFSLDHKEDEAAQIYQARFGCPPEQILEYDGLLRLGPLPEKDERVFCQASFFPSFSDWPPTTPMA